MAWFTYSADVQVRGESLVRLERERNCPLCYHKLQRLAWRDLLPPYHWQPFGYICSTCNAVYVGAEARLTRPKRPQGPYSPEELLERSKGPRRKGTVQPA